MIWNKKFTLEKLMQSLKNDEEFGFSDNDFGFRRFPEPDSKPKTDLSNNPEYTSDSYWSEFKQRLREN